MTNKQQIIDDFSSSETISKNIEALHDVSQKIQTISEKFISFDLKLSAYITKNIDPQIRIDTSSIQPDQLPSLPGLSSSGNTD